MQKTIFIALAGLVGDSLAVLAFGIRGETVWRDVSLRNDGGQPDRLSNNRRGVLSD